MDTLTDENCQEHIIMLVDPTDYFAALDDSVDNFMGDLGRLMHNKFADVWMDWNDDETIVEDELLSWVLDGEFSMPITCQTYHGEWVQGNGHHRLAIALFAGLSAIPVLFSENSDYMVSEVTGD